MANFPTIPTGGRVLTSNQADSSGTRTFPNLNGLTKNAGDLLIAIIAVYQSSASAGAVFSGWGGGFTEFLDVGGTTSNMSIGAAYKWSTGSETGTFTVTQAATVTGFASMILLSIPGAHATEPPVGGAITNGTAAAADVAALNPANWDTEDTLWIAVGASGETSATGSWTGVASAPTNYGNYVDTNTSDTSTIGECELAVAFRQNRTGSEDPGAFSVDTSNARNSSVLIAVRPAPYAGQVNNVITVTPVIDGTLPRGLVSWASLEVPAATGPADVNGAVDDIITVNRVTKETLGAFSRADDVITVTVAPTGRVEMFSRVDDPITVDRVTAGSPVKFGQVNDVITVGITTLGIVTALGRVDDLLTFNSTTAALLGAFSRVDDPIAVNRTTAAWAEMFSRVDDPIAVNRVVQGFATRASAVAFPITFDAAVAATKTSFGQVALPILFSITADGAVAGAVSGAASAVITVDRVAAGLLTAKGAVADPIVVTETTAGFAEKFAASTSTYAFTFTDAGTWYLAGRVALPILVDPVVAARVGARSLVDSQIVFGAAIAGAGVVLGNVDSPFVVLIDTNGDVNVVQMLDTVYTGRIGYADNGEPAGAAGPRIADTVAGTILEDFTE